jgi:hypothetical protein
MHETFLHCVLQLYSFRYGLQNSLWLDECLMSDVLFISCFISFRFDAVFRPAWSIREYLGDF